MSSTNIDNCIKYSGEKENELSMVFSFHHLKVDYKDNDKWKLLDFDFVSLKNILFSWQESMQENNAWSLYFGAIMISLEYYQDSVMIRNIIKSLLRCLLLLCIV